MPLVRNTVQTRLGPEDLSSTAGFYTPAVSRYANFNRARRPFTDHGRRTEITCSEYGLSEIAQSRGTPPVAAAAAAARERLLDSPPHRAFFRSLRPRTSCLTIPLKANRHRPWRTAPKRNGQSGFLSFRLTLWFIFVPVFPSREATLTPHGLGE